MSKAEERALEAFPLKIDGDNRGSYDLNAVKRIVYQLGYEQAEKDLELTWEDIERIDDISIRLDGTEESKGMMSNKEFYQEVLKIFKKYKAKTL